MSSSQVCLDEVPIESKSHGVEEMVSEKAWLLSSKVEKGQAQNVPYDVGSASLFETAYAHPWLSGKQKAKQQNIPYDVGSANLFETAYAHPWLSGKNTNGTKDQVQNAPYDVGSASLFETAYAHPWLSGKKSVETIPKQQNVPYDVGSASLFETAYAHPWLQGKKTTETEGQTVPYDVGSASLFETSYSHPWLRTTSLAAIPWAYYDRFTKWSVALITGTEAGLDQWIGGISPERYHASKSELPSYSSCLLK